MPRRIALVGNGGGGKSTAARELSSRLGVPFYSVDQVQFEPGWERADPAKVARWHAEILAQEAWIIDGWGSWELIDVRFGAADAILLIDMPLETHLEWAARRPLLSDQPDAPAGCDYAAVEELMKETLIHVDAELMPILREKVTACEADKLVVWVRKPEDWRAGLEAIVYPISAFSADRSSGDTSSSR